MIWNIFFYLAWLKDVVSVSEWLQLLVLKTNLFPDYSTVIFVWDVVLCRVLHHEGKSRSVAVANIGVKNQVKYADEGCGCQECDFYNYPTCNTKLVIGHGCLHGVICRHGNLVGPMRQFLWIFSSSTCVLCVFSNCLLFSIADGFDSYANNADGERESKLNPLFIHFISFLTLHFYLWRWHG